MNRNDKKEHRSKKGLVDPNAIREFEVYHENTLLSFLYEKMPDVPKKNMKRILANHQVSVGGAPVSQFDYPIYPEDVVVVSSRPIAKRTRKDLPIIYEDDDIVVINKPSGLLSTATEREKGRTAYRLVSDYVTAKDPKGRIFVVHRLDEDTSGVLIFAKNWEIREALQNSWQKIVKKRGYYAIVEGKMNPPEGTLKDYLNQNSMQLVYVTDRPEEGKLAITHYKTMAVNGDYSLLDVSIDTGRKNQIRVQLGHTGHYVAGDDKYGEPSDPLKRLCLHAYELDLINPKTGKLMKFHAPLPDEFKTLMFKDAPAKAKTAKAPRRNRESKKAEKIRRAEQRKPFYQRKNASFQGEKNKS